MSNNTIFSAFGQMLNDPNNTYFTGANEAYEKWMTSQSLISRGIDPKSVFPDKKPGKSPEEIEAEKAEKEAKAKKAKEEQEAAAAKKKQEQEEARKKAEENKDKGPKTLSFDEAINEMAKVYSIESARKVLMENIVRGREKELDDMVKDPAKAKTLSEVDQVIWRRREAKKAEPTTPKGKTVRLHSIYGLAPKKPVTPQIEVVLCQKPQPRVKVVSIQDGCYHFPGTHTGALYVQRGFDVIPTFGLKCYAI